MKLSNKKRIESLEKVLTVKRCRARSAMVCFDPSITDFEINSLEIDADVILALPDNGRRCCNEERIPKGSYKVTYSYLLKRPK